MWNPLTSLSSSSSSSSSHSNFILPEAYIEELKLRFSSCFPLILVDGKSIDLNNLSSLLSLSHDLNYILLYNKRLDSIEHENIEKEENETVLNIINFLNMIIKNNIQDNKEINQSEDVNSKDNEDKEQIEEEKKKEILMNLNFDFHIIKELNYFSILNILQCLFLLSFQSSSEQTLKSLYNKFFSLTFSPIISKSISLPTSTSLSFDDFFLFFLNQVLILSLFCLDLMTDLKKNDFSLIRSTIDLCILKRDFHLASQLLQIHRHSLASSLLQQNYLRRIENFLENSIKDSIPSSLSSSPSVLPSSSSSSSSSFSFSSSSSSSSSSSITSSTYLKTTLTTPSCIIFLSDIIKIIKKNGENENIKDFFPLFMSLFTIEEVSIEEEKSLANNEKLLDKTINEIKKVEENQIEDLTIKEVEKKKEKKETEEKIETRRSERNKRKEEENLSQNNNKTLDNEEKIDDYFLRLDQISSLYQSFSFTTSSSSSSSLNQLTLLTSLLPKDDDEDEKEVREIIERENEEENYNEKDKENGIFNTEFFKINTIQSEVFLRFNEEFLVYFTDFQNYLYTNYLHLIIKYTSTIPSSISYHTLSIIFDDLFIELYKFVLSVSDFILTKSFFFNNFAPFVELFTQFDWNSLLYSICFSFYHFLQKISFISTPSSVQFSSSKHQLPFFLSSSSSSGLYNTLLLSNFSPNLLQALRESFINYFFDVSTKKDEMKKKNIQFYEFSSYFIYFTSFSTLNSNIFIEIDLKIEKEEDLSEILLKIREKFWLLSFYYYEILITNSCDGLEKKKLSSSSPSSDLSFLASLSYSEFDLSSLIIPENYTSSASLLIQSLSSLLSSSKSLTSLKFFSLSSSSIFSILSLKSLKTIQEKIKNYEITKKFLLKNQKNDDKSKKKNKELQGNGKTPKNYEVGLISVEMCLNLPELNSIVNNINSSLLLKILLPQSSLLDSLGYIILFSIKYHQNLDIFERFLIKFFYYIDKIKDEVANFDSFVSHLEDLKLIFTNYNKEKYYNILVNDYSLVNIEVKKNQRITFLSRLLNNFVVIINNFFQFFYSHSSSTSSSTSSSFLLSTSFEPLLGFMKNIFLFLQNTFSHYFNSFLPEDLTYEDFILLNTDMVFQSIYVLFNEKISQIISLSSSESSLSESSSPNPEFSSSSIINYNLQSLEFLTIILNFISEKIPSYFDLPYQLYFINFSTSSLFSQIMELFSKVPHQSITKNLGSHLILLQINSLRPLIFNPPTSNTFSSSFFHSDSHSVSLTNLNKLIDLLTYLEYFFFNFFFKSSGYLREFFSSLSHILFSLLEAIYPLPSDQFGSLYDPLLSFYSRIHERMFNIYNFLKSGVVENRGGCKGIYSLWDEIFLLSSIPLPSSTSPNVPIEYLFSAFKMFLFTDKLNNKKEFGLRIEKREMLAWIFHVFLQHLSSSTFSTSLSSSFSSSLLFKRIFKYYFDDEEKKIAIDNILRDFSKKQEQLEPKVLKKLSKSEKNIENFREITSNLFFLGIKYDLIIDPIDFLSKLQSKNSEDNQSLILVTFFGKSGEIETNFFEYLSFFSSLYHLKSKFLLSLYDVFFNPSRRTSWEVLFSELAQFYDGASEILIQDSNEKGLMELLKSELKKFRDQDRDKNKFLDINSIDDVLYLLYPSLPSTLISNVDSSSSSSSIISSPSTKFTLRYIQLLESILLRLYSNSSSFSFYFSDENILSNFSSLSTFIPDYKKIKYSLPLIYWFKKESSTMLHIEQLNFSENFSKKSTNDIVRIYYRTGREQNDTKLLPIEKDVDLEEKEEITEEEEEEEVRDKKIEEKIKVLHKFSQYVTFPSSFSLELYQCYHRNLKKIISIALLKLHLGSFLEMIHLLSSSNFFKVEELNNKINMNKKPRLDEEIMEANESTDEDNVKEEENNYLILDSYGIHLISSSLLSLDKKSLYNSIKEIYTQENFLNEDIFAISTSSLYTFLSSPSSLDSISKSIDYSNLALSFAITNGRSSEINEGDLPADQFSLLFSLVKKSSKKNSEKNPFTNHIKINVFYDLFNLRLQICLQFLNKRKFLPAYFYDEKNKIEEILEKIMKIENIEQFYKNEFVDENVDVNNESDLIEINILNKIWMIIFHSIYGLILCKERDAHRYCSIYRFFKSLQRIVEIIESEKIKSSGALPPWVLNFISNSISSSSTSSSSSFSILSKFSSPLFLGWTYDGIFSLLSKFLPKTKQLNCIWKPSEIESQWSELLSNPIYFHYYNYKFYNLIISISYLNNDYEHLYKLILHFFTCQNPSESLYQLIELSLNNYLSLIFSSLTNLSLTSISSSSPFSSSTFSSDIKNLCVSLESCFTNSQVTKHFKHIEQLNKILGITLKRFFLYYNKQIEEILYNLLFSLSTFLPSFFTLSSSSLIENISSLSNYLSFTNVSNPSISSFSTANLYLTFFNKIKDIPPKNLYIYSSNIISQYKLCISYIEKLKNINFDIIKENDDVVKDEIEPNKVLSEKQDQEKIKDIIDNAVKDDQEKTSNVTDNKELHEEEQNDEEDEEDNEKDVVEEEEDEDDDEDLSLFSQNSSISLHQMCSSLSYKSSRNKSEYMQSSFIFGSNSSTCSSSTSSDSPLSNSPYFSISLKRTNPFQDEEINKKTPIIN